MPIPSAAQSTCCKPGPQRAGAPGRRNCLVVGDSVSIGYTGVAAKALADVCDVQHGPWDEHDGGALNTLYGVACLDDWLVTQNQTAVRWDAVLFNFGLHELDDNSTAWIEGQYVPRLANITKRLQATGAALVYATTTPFMPLRTQGDTVVEQLNDAARGVAAAAGGVGVVDLHGVITGHCGDVYTDCDICKLSPCSYHYNNDGYTLLGEAAAQALREALKPADAGARGDAAALEPAARGARVGAGAVL